MPFRGYDAHPVVTGVSNVNIVVAVQRDGHWEIKVGEFCGTAIAAWRRRRGAGRDGPVAGERHNVSRGSFHRAHPVISGVSNIDVAGAVHRNPLRSVQPGQSGQTVIAAFGLLARFAHAGYGRQIAARIHFANGVISRIRDVDVAVAVNGQPGRIPKRFLVGWARLVVVRDVANTRKLRHHVARILFENILGKGRGDVEISARVRYCSRRTRDIGLLRTAIDRASAGHGVDGVLGTQRQNENQQAEENGRAQSAER